MLKLSAAIASILQVLVLCEAQDAPITQTKYGPIRGKVVTNTDGRTVDGYLGVPFAKTPTGQLRFKHPLNPDPWSEALETTSFQKSCLQFLPGALKTLPGSRRIAPLTDTSEDCLYLNIWVPKPTPKDAPVFVFFHSGAFTLGSAATAIYDPSYFVAQEGVIVVTVNYRLVSLGFIYLEHPEIDLNNGLMDQIQAMKWVRDNIANFGGDPDNVVLQGSSAGAISIGFHLVSPVSKGLFNRAVLQSGYPTGKWALKPKQDMKELTRQLLENLDCPIKDGNVTMANIECIRNVDGNELVANEPRADYDVVALYPVVDGYIIPDEPELLLKQGKFNSVELLMGVTQNEGTFLASFYDPLTLNLASDKITVSKQDILKTVRNFLPNADETLKKAIEYHYIDFEELDNSKSLIKSMDDLLAELIFICPGNNLAKKYSKAGNDVFAYYFTHLSPSAEWAKWVGVPHTEEFGYVYGEPFFKNSKFTDEDKMFSHRMMRYWANFARTGNPNQNPDAKLLNYPTWPKYTPSQRQHFILNPNSTNSQVVEKLREMNCQFWDLFVPYLESVPK